MIKISVFSTDILFANMLRGELELANKEYLVKINECEASEGLSIDGDGGVVVIDLDSLYGKMNFFGCAVIGFSRFEATLSAEIKNKCKAILHRPFLVDHLIYAVQKAVSNMDEPGSLLPEETNKRLYLDMASSCVEIDGRTVHLSDNEAAILNILMERIGEPVSRDEIGERLSSSAGNMSDVYICHLRSKLEDGGSERFIYTVRGKGYMLKVNYKNF
jgi:hypothetical protein